jgi:hypothetical protein
MSRNGGRVPQRANPHLNTNFSLNITHSSLDSVPIHEDQIDVVIMELNLAVFKTRKCPKKEEVKSHQPSIITSNARSTTMR